MEVDHDFVAVRVVGPRKAAKINYELDYGQVSIDRDVDAGTFKQCLVAGSRVEPAILIRESLPKSEVHSSSAVRVKADRWLFDQRSIHR